MLEIQNLQKTYGSGATVTEAIAGLTFAVQEREFVCVVGPSGCGKTTLLKCISGLLSPSSGQVVLRGERVSGPPREMALVFQDYSRSLMPWMTVRQNVLLPIRRKKLGREGEAEILRSSLESVGLSRFAEHYPWQLSGGMQQRVAIARAIAYQPRILLMDEPFASVDAQTRSELEDLILGIRAQYGLTILFVTHDIAESVYLGDRVVVLTRSPTMVGEILEVDLPTPRDQVETKTLPQFAEMQAHIYQSIKGQPTLTRD